MSVESFQRLSGEKRNRIIEEGIREFAEYGFDGASTNRIVKQAGISKGSLFNYFGSKDDFYLYLAHHALSRVTPLLRTKMETMPPDILTRLLQLTEAVIEIYIENPLYYRFFMGVLDSGAFHLQQKLLKKNAELFNFMDLFTGVDTSRFLLDEQATFTLIKWLFTGIKQELFEIQAVHDDPKNLREEFAGRVKKVLKALESGIFT